MFEFIFTKMYLVILFLLPYNLIVKCSKCNRPRTRVKSIRHLGHKIQQAFAPRVIEAWGGLEQRVWTWGRWGEALGKDFRTEWHLSWDLTREWGFPWQRRKGEGHSAEEKVWWRIMRNYEFTEERMKNRKKKRKLYTHTYTPTHPLQLVDSFIIGQLLWLTSNMKIRPSSPILTVLVQMLSWSSPSLLYSITLNDVCFHYSGYYSDLLSLPPPFFPWVPFFWGSLDKAKSWAKVFC